MPFPLVSNEQDLLQQFQQGSPQAFRKIYDAYYFSIYKYSAKFLANGTEAEDVTADTFIKLWNKKEDFPNLNHVEAFLKVTARNASLDVLKHNKVVIDKQPELIRELSEDTDAYFASLQVLEKLMSDIYEKADEMPKRMREIFLLSFKEGLSPAQIAEKLQLSVQTVSNQKANALKFLKLAFSGEVTALLLPFLIENRGNVQDILRYIYINVKKS